MSDYRNDVIEVLAASEAMLLERVEQQAGEIATWRMIAIEGLHAGHNLHVENRRLQRTVDRLREELRERMGVPLARVLEDLRQAEAA